MKMIKSGLMGGMLFVLACTGCMAYEAPSKETFPVVIAIEKSVPFAVEDQVDWTQYSVRSVNLNVNGWTSVFDRESKEALVVSVVQKLKGKEYWEVCYGTTVSGLVGMIYCYYLERSSYEFLAAYRMK